MRRQIGLLSLALVTAFAMGGCGQSNSQEAVAVGQARALSSGSGEATVAVQNDWGAGYCANVIIVNKGTVAISSWTLVLQIPNTKISNLWSGDYTQDGDQITVTPLAFNTIITGGSSATFGFCTTTTSATDHTPVLVSLDVIGGDVVGAGGSPGVGGGQGVGGSVELGGETSVGGATGVGGASSPDVGGATSEGGATDVGGTSSVEVGGTSAAGGAADIGGTTSADVGGSGSGGAPEVGGTGAEVGGSSSTGNSSQGVAVLDVNSDWKAGYCTNITLKNEGTAVSTDWTLTLNVPQAEIGNLWGGTYTRDGSTVVIKPLSYDAAISPGASTSIGYCATTTGTSYQPTLISFVLTTAAAGDAGTGGAPSSGGAPATGGNMGTGGEQATGGTSATGGAQATGGDMGTGGEQATGGASATGGAQATGGTPSTGGSSSAGGAGGQSAVVATLKITSGSDWAEGYCANVDVVNNSLLQVTNWIVDVNFPSANIMNLWNGTPTINGELMSVAAASYNQQIAPGASANFGFCALSQVHTPTVASISFTN